SHPKSSFHTEVDERNFLADTPRLKLRDLHAGTAILVLKGGLALDGLVTDENQHPIVQAGVSFGELSGAATLKHETGNDGSFRLSNLAAGKGHITVKAAGFAPERIEVEVSTNSSPLTVSLRPGALLRVRVVDQYSKGVAHARVQLQAWRGNNTFDWG